MIIFNYKEKNKIIFPYLKCHFLAEIRLPESPCVFPFLEENRYEGGGWRIDSEMLRAPHENRFVASWISRWGDHEYGIKRLWKCLFVEFWALFEEQITFEISRLATLWPSVDIIFRISCAGLVSLDIGRFNPNLKSETKINFFISQLWMVKKCTFWLFSRFETEKWKFLFLSQTSNLGWTCLYRG